MGDSLPETCQNLNFNHKSGGPELVIQAALTDEDKAEVGMYYRVVVGAAGGAQKETHTLTKDLKG